jgi:NADH-quinone oxidoreductase subunit A
MDVQGPVAAVMAASASPAVAGAAGPSTFEIVYPLTILLALALGLPAALFGLNIILSKFAHGERLKTAGKDEPVESGLPIAVGGSGEKFSVKFYLIAMLFLAFDIEVAFLYPWAWYFRIGGPAMVWLLIVFLVILEVGYLYLYRKGALDWE